MYPAFNECEYKHSYSLLSSSVFVAVLGLNNEDQNFLFKMTGLCAKDGLALVVPVVSVKMCWNIEPFLMKAVQTSKGGYDGS